ncbi:TBC1 domain family member [Musa troglodytarum]|uniref:TBC1 domain family member n=1 Tax=Musa troglodytarum TaxID=320322 RepID=A0A9E7FUT4_9LILI|nr:TBC1 domain family member [Musa troglodytarum]
MLLKGKIRLPNTIVPRFPDRIKPPEKKKEDDDHAEGREEEELRTFQVGGGGGEERSEGEIWPDDGDENWTVSRAHHRIKIDIGREVSWDKRSELEFELSQKVVNLEALRSIASCGHLAEEFRSIVWKVPSKGLQICAELLCWITKRTGVLGFAHSLRVEEAKQRYNTAYCLLHSLVEHSCIDPKSFTYGYLDEKSIDTSLMKFPGLCPSALSWNIEFAIAFSSSTAHITTKRSPSMRARDQ